MPRCDKCGAESAEAAIYCHMCGVGISAPGVGEAGLTSVHRRLDALESLVSEYGLLIDEHADEINEHTEAVHVHESILGSSNVYHASFWPRARAILGHNMAAGLIIYVGLLVVALASGR